MLNAMVQQLNTFGGSNQHSSLQKHARDSICHKRQPWCITWECIAFKIIAELFSVLKYKFCFPIILHDGHSCLNSVEFSKRLSFHDIKKQVGRLVVRSWFMNKDSMIMFYCKIHCNLKCDYSWNYFRISTPVNFVGVLIMVLHWFKNSVQCYCDFPLV